MNPTCAWRASTCRALSPIRCRPPPNSPVAVTLPNASSAAHGHINEVEAAWLVHEPERAAVANDIWRSLRAWKRELLPTAGII